MSIQFINNELGTLISATNDEKRVRIDIIDIEPTTIIGLDYTYIFESAKEIDLFIEELQGLKKEVYG